MLGASRAALIGAEAPGFTFISTTWTNGSATYYTLSDSNKTISRNTNSAVWPNPSYITDNWSTGIRSIDIKLTAVSGTQRIQLGVVTPGFTTGAEMSDNNSSFFGQQFSGRSVNDIFTLEHDADTGETKMFVNGVLSRSGTSTISGARTFFFQEYSVTKTLQIVDMVYEPTIGDTKFVR
jgi:hypothetical protein